MGMKNIRMSEIYDLLENMIMEFDVVKIYFQDKKINIVDEKNEIIDIIEDDDEFANKVKRLMQFRKDITITLDKRSLIRYYQYVENVFQKTEKYQINSDFYFPEIEVLNNKVITRDHIDSVLMDYESDYILLRILDQFQFYRQEDKNDVWHIYWYYYFHDEYIIILQKYDYYVINYKLFFVKQ